MCHIIRNNKLIQSIKKIFNFSPYYVITGRHIGFMSVFGAGSSVYNFKDNLFKIRRNKDGVNICDLTQGFFDILNSKKFMAISSVHG